MSIQSHTVSHQPLADMEGKEILFELSHSKKMIEKKLGNVVRHLSLPHGYKEAGVWAMAQEIDYQSICTSDVGFARNGSQGPWLKRISIGDAISEERFCLIVKGNYQGIIGMLLTKTIKNTLRRIVGVNTYRRLYRRVYGIR